MTVATVTFGLDNQTVEKENESEREGSDGGGREKKRVVRNWLVISNKRTLTFAKVSINERKTPLTVVLRDNRQ